MKLSEIEKPSLPIPRAIEDGIETVAEYNLWAQGYIVGFRDAGEVALKAFREDDFEPFPSFAEESVMLHEEKIKGEQK